MFGSVVAVGDADWVELFNDVLPGGFVVGVADPLGYARLAVAVEDAGFEVRDCLNIVLGEGPAGQPAGHLLAVLARKPFTGTVVANVVEHGVGGLNIDGCRIGFVSDADKAESTGKNRHADFGSAPEENRVYGDRSMLERTNYDAPGRWPANTLLVHAAGCEQVGTREVQSDGHHPANRGPSGDFAGETGGLNGQAGLVERKSGKETVSAWVCAVGCPVNGLDAQSGNVRTAGKYVRGQMGSSTGGSVIDINRGGHQTAQYDDTGGASRFFLNAEWVDTDTGSLPASVLDYLTTLITPEGAECLLVSS